MDSKKHNAMRFVEVAVNLPVYQTYTYSVPADYIDDISAGMRVLVPFGQRRVTGYVLGAQQPPKLKDIKPILDIPDDSALFPASLIPFIRWVADYYIHPIGDVIKCALPGGLNMSELIMLSITPDGRKAMINGLDGAALDVLTLLIKGDQPLKDIRSALPHRLPLTFIESMGDRGWIRIRRQIKKDRIGPRLEMFVKSGQSLTKPNSLKGQRKKIWERVIQSGEISIRQLKTEVRTTTRTIKALVDTGYLAFIKKSVYRDPFGDTVAADTPHILNPDQNTALKQVSHTIEKGFNTFLLAGVTGSGKTEVYMQLAAEVIRRKLPVIILIPEIALISQMERRFRARFGEQVAILHSGLSYGERYDQWMRISRGEVSIAIGARSAIFAPFSRVGLIVVDEEHDTSYKQEGNLRYNARDLAVVRAKLDHGVALLGSATPSIQSYYNATQKKFVELSLNQRVEERQLPKITIVDLRNNRDLRGMDRFISAELRQAMIETLNRNEQVLLFLNRRGFANFPVCGECGQTVKCKHCDISMTLHQKANALRCHYCGFSRPALAACTVCGSSHIRYLGLGTEKIESAVRELFPDARIARMDRDTTKRKGAIVKILKELRNGNIDVLIGTQMVAKGHDFPNITLVGILCADLSMNFPDFRAGERTFQLLAQVSGRAGRGDLPGRVILQTYNPDHFSILAAKKQDFKSFYEQEIDFRRTLKYPPFSRIIQLKVSGQDKRQSESLAGSLGQCCRRLRQGEPYFQNSVTVMGPIEAALPRIAGKYRWQILLKAQKVKTLHRFARSLMADHPTLFNRRGIHVAVDVDPYFMM